MKTNTKKIKNEDDLKKNQEWRQLQKKSKNEEDLKKSNMKTTSKKSKGRQSKKNEYDLKK